MTSKYNKTQLNIVTSQGRLFIHRDHGAHLNRFGYVLKKVSKHLNKNPLTILDVGSGTNRQLGMCLYSNKTSSAIKHYHSVDLRPMKEDVTFKFDSTHHVQDVTTGLPSVNPDLITCFEVIEHMSKESGEDLLKSIENAADKNTEIYFSTPCYNGEKLPANHIYEWRYEELKERLEKDFEIIEHFGTFLNTRGMEEALEEFIPAETIEKLKSFYHHHLLSPMFAPLIPAKSRNCIWLLKKRN